MRDEAELALDSAAFLGAAYADCRTVQRSVQELAARNGELERIALSEEEGLGVRVLVDGCWGFASGERIDRESAAAVARTAVLTARASARVPGRPVRLTPAPARAGSYRTPIAIDPFAISLEDKADLLLAADAAMARVRGLSARRGSLELRREARLFASSEGSVIDQTIIESGGGIEAVAAGGDEVQERSHPNSFGRQQLCAGWEAVEEMDLAGNGERIASEAVALLTADPCPSGTMTVILDATQAALQVHESCGHAVELDRVLGWEAAYAGTSFLDPGMLGFRYGSDHVTITADATSARGLGTFGWDDEGVPAQRTVIVEDGVLRGFMTSRQTAAELGMESSGTMRADGWSHLPLIRMTNVNLEPGESSLEEMIGTTEHGLYLETNRSWSIDDRRLNFQFGTQNGWEIRDGRLVRLVRNPLYHGVTPAFWRSCDAVAGPAEWRMHGVVNCGKGQPPQAMHVGHGAAPCRFRDVRVGPGA